MQRGNPMKLNFQRSEIPKLNIPTNRPQGVDEKNYAIISYDFYS